MNFSKIPTVYFCLLISITLSSFLPQTQNSAPLARVWFYGAKMTNTVLNTHRNDPEFDHFIFQPMMRDADDRRDYYYLVCYAIKANGDVMNGGNPLDLDVVFDKPQRVVDKLSLANIKVTEKHIRYLYADGSTSDLWLMPEKYGKKPEYISYRLQTTAPVVTTSGKTGTPVKILASLLVNPSPPAQPSENEPPARVSN